MAVLRKNKENGMFETTSDRLALCRRISDIVINASETAFEKDITVQKKGHGNFVTSADLKIEQILKEQLSRLYPDIGFISEEAAPDIRNCFNWIIDPIDGTTNYLNHFPFAVSIALENRETEEIIAGIVYSPLDRELYFAGKGTGSYKINSNGFCEQIQVKEFDATEGISIFGMPYDRSKTRKILNIAEEYYSVSSDLKRIGPASLDICRVASGQAKLYFELDLNIWDVSAGLVILEEAGGSFEIKDDLFLFYGKHSPI